VDQFMFGVELGVHPTVAPLSTFSDFYRAELDGQVRRAGLMLGSSAAANDVVHDAFIQIYRRWDEIAEPGPYLNRAVLNGCRDVGRRRSREMRLLPRLVDRSGGEAHQESLADALSTLPFNQRAAIVLRFYVGLSIRDIARALECQPGTVGPWITRGLKQLRKEIDP
jgi:RNA polymerase sigma factor (sigma-70 family)